MINTIIKYTQLPDEDDFYMAYSEVMLACTDPQINITKETIFLTGKDINIQLNRKFIKDFKVELENDTHV